MDGWKAGVLLLWAVCLLAIFCSLLHFLRTASPLDWLLALSVVLLLADRGRRSSD